MVEITPSQRGPLGALVPGLGGNINLVGAPGLHGAGVGR